jgi:glucosamine--fructose-6-phosphate aminotransferase (isomerizing)
VGIKTVPTPCQFDEEGNMCGIVGYIGPKNATPIILNGLKRLEYRGYDSVVWRLYKQPDRNPPGCGKLNKLVDLINDIPVSGQVGIGHTRWATHGEPSATPTRTLVTKRGGRA